MKLTKQLIAALAVCMLTAFAVAGCGNDQQQTKPASGLTIENPWARVTTPGQKNGAAYMKISSTSPDKLIGVDVPANIADHAELHKVVMATGSVKSEGGMGSDGMQSKSGAKMSMKQVPAIPVPAELKPGGYHVMLIGLKAPIAKGDSVPLTLTFEKAGLKRITAVAKD